MSTAKKKVTTTDSSNSKQQESQELNKSLTDSQITHAPALDSETSPTKQTDQTKSDSAPWPEKDLIRLKQIGCHKSVLSELSIPQLASVVTAYLVNYESQLQPSFSHIRKILTHHFSRSFIFGSSFANADQHERKNFFRILVNALDQVSDKQAKVGLAIRAKQFIRGLA